MLTQPGNRCPAVRCAWALLLLAGSLSGCKSRYVAETNTMAAAPLPVAAEPTHKAPAAVALRQTSGDPAPTISLDDPQPAAPTAAAPPATGTPSGSGTINGHPNGLRREVLNTAVQGMLGTLAGCFSPSAQNPMVAVSFEADPAGRASMVRVDGAAAETEHCIRQAIDNLHFPRFEGNGVRINLPLSFHQERIEHPSGPSGAAAPPANAPLFLNP